MARTHHFGRRKVDLPLLDLPGRALRVATVSFAALVAVFVYLATPRVALDSPLAFWAGLIGGLVLAVRARSRRVMWAGFAIAAGTVVLAWATSTAIFHHARYSDLLGPETTAAIDEKLPKLDLNDAPLVSHEMALLAAQRRLSEVPGVGSVTQVVRLDKQVVNGALVWIGVLEHKRFTAWWSRGLTPGYVKVSARDVSDVDLVTEAGGRAMKLRYLRSAFFSDRLARHLWTSGYMTEGLTDYTYEVDDAGRPWAVVTAFKPTIGLDGRKVTGVVLVDLETGESTRYGLEDVPGWVDRVQPAELIVDQVADRLEYVHGWFNPSKTDELRISGEPDVVYEGGRAKYIVGLTSTSKEGGLVGFMTVDTRTKEVLRHTIAGVTETVAQGAAENVNPEKRYKATNPLPFMVAGRPTYVMALRDSNGVARSFAAVAIEDVQHVATGETLASAVRLYQTRGSVNRTVAGAGPGAASLKAHARVERISAEVRDGNTGYTLVIAGFPGKLFVAVANLSEELAVTRPGDLVSLTGVDNGTRTVPLATFTNETLAGAAGHESGPDRTSASR